MNENRISISRGNAKTGFIPSVSFPAVVTCAENVPCVKSCYALALCKFRPSVAAAYERNLRVYKEDPDAFWAQIKAAAAVNSYFRYFVCGDIPDVAFFIDSIAVAKMYPKCTFLMYTKKYRLVNSVLDLIPRPENLLIRFSGWGPRWPVPNPHNLPIFDVILDGMNPAPGAFICTGSCTYCIENNTGCYSPNGPEYIQCWQHDHGKNKDKKVKRGAK